MYRNEIPVRAVREVISRSGSPDNINWQKTPTGGWVAQYRTGVAITRIDFTATGVWTEIRKNYTQPPPDIILMVENSFIGYRVNNVSGIIFPWDEKNMLFSIVIIKAGNCKVLKAFKGEISVFSDFYNPSLTKK